MRLARGERGQSLVETALVLPILLLLVIGIIDVARAAWMTNTLAFAVREGTRYASVHGIGSTTPSSPGNTSAVQDAVRRYAVGVSGVSVTVTYLDGDNDVTNRVQVDATAPFTPALSDAFLGGGLRVTLRSGSTFFIHN